MSAQGFELVPLDCPACGAPLAAEETDVVFYCTACRTGYRYAPEEKRGLAAVEVSFVASPHQAAEGYLPFWLLPAKVEILQRDAAGGALRGLVQLFVGGDGAEDASSGDGHFVLPAFRLPIAEAVELALRYTQEFPSLDELLGERLTGGSFGAGDAVTLAHYVLIASEVRKRDMLKNLDYRLTAGTPRLLGVPWVSVGPRRVDAVFGLSMGAAGS
ncbi:MAG TPA: hypothetical protein VKU40_10680 [Thermoanaerobaculia bacterium]|nr:hypothetical protein [Thermoanaerobaculia bacterium]